MQILKEDFKVLDLFFESCSIDYNILMKEKIDNTFFSDYSNQRVVNSFLFNYIKIQDKMGAKLFKSVLIELKEIDDSSVPMIDVLNILEKLNIINRADEWDMLREIRNSITHEYPSDIDERVENILFTLKGYAVLAGIYANIKSYCLSRGLL